MAHHGAQPPLFKPLGVQRLFWVRCTDTDAGHTPDAPRIDVRDPRVAAGLVDLLVNASATKSAQRRNDGAAVSGPILWHDGELGLVSEVIFRASHADYPWGHLMGLPAPLMAQSPPASAGWAVLLLLQDDDGTVLAFFRSEDEVRQAFGSADATRSGRYRSPVRDIRGCIENEQACMGFVDYVAGTQVCSSD